MCIRDRWLFYRFRVVSLLLTRGTWFRGKGGRNSYLSSRCNINTGQCSHHEVIFKAVGRMSEGLHVLLLCIFDTWTLIFQTAKRRPSRFWFHFELVKFTDISPTPPLILQGSKMQRCDASHRNCHLLCSNFTTYKSRSSSCSLCLKTLLIILLLLV